MNKENILEKTIEIRINQLRESLAKDNIDTLLVLVGENRRYLSGFTGEDTSFDESAGALIISDSRLVLATDSRYELQAKIESPLYDIVCHQKGLAKELPKIFDELKTKRLGFESIRMSYKQYSEITEEIKSNRQKIELISTENRVENLRIIKSESEIDALRKALLLAESVFTNCASVIRPGMTEKEIAWAMEKGMREAGAEAQAFPTIVASGPNSALPHAIPGERKFNAGEPILFDWGARLDGYNSDISRTLSIGTPEEPFQSVFQTVLDAQRMAVEAIKPGVGSKAVDKIARDHIEKKGFKGKFGHGLGHGTGLAIHEPPRLSPLKDIPLEPGMVSTVEPGIYIPDWGGVRLENMIVVREDGAEVLNRIDAASYQIES
jgi:Xaa-Pro aminopeptidase